MPKLFKKDIVGHQVVTVAEMDWSGTKNGKLLSIAESQFDVLLTVDRSIEYQQNIQGRLIALVVMDAPNKLRLLRPLVPALLKALENIQPGTIVHIQP
jgi:hypothetical protein